jgi:hypothetical protein
VAEVVKLLLLDPLKIDLILTPLLHRDRDQLLMHIVMISKPKNTTLGFSLTLLTGSPVLLSLHRCKNLTRGIDISEILMIVRSFGLVVAKSAPLGSEGHALQ